MSWKRLMVHLELEGDNQGVLRIAGELAARLGAKVIGIAACRPIQPVYEEGFAAGDILAEDRAEIAAELAAAESQFRAALGGHALEWRSCITYAPLADYIAEQARAADLIITGKDLGPKLFDESRRVHIGDLAMRAGRPMLLVAQGVTTLPLNRVFVGWKETREARRAAADALPLLQLAGQVGVLEIADVDELAPVQARLADVAGWLAGHGVSAEPLALAAGDLEAGRLRTALLDRGCDLFVAGAYGHGRIGEWIFGGVTRDVLLNPDFCVLISH